MRRSNLLLTSKELELYKGMVRHSVEMSGCNLFDLAVRKLGCDYQKFGASRLYYSASLRIWTIHHLEDYQIPVGVNMNDIDTLMAQFYVALYMIAACVLMALVAWRAVRWNTWLRRGYLALVIALFYVGWFYGA
jgi:hypothetical protein